MLNLRFVEFFGALQFLTADPSPKILLLDNWESSEIRDVFQSGMTVDGSEISAQLSYRKQLYVHVQLDKQTMFSDWIPIRRERLDLGTLTISSRGGSSGLIRIKLKYGLATGCVESDDGRPFLELVFEQGKDIVVSDTTFPGCEFNSNKVHDAIHQ